jgi:GTP-binding protein Era
MELTEFKAGFVAIIGKPNVGKSTLMNRLLGEKLSIVSPKPQTTRLNVKGIFNTDKAQIIFLDTPGFLEPRYELQEKMLNYLTDSLKSSDLIMFIADLNDFPTDYDKKVIDILKSFKKLAIGILNKNDLMVQDIAEKRDYLQQFVEKVFVISAINDTDFQELTKTLIHYLPYNPPVYNQAHLADMPLRFFAQEIIREKIFLTYGEEIPYCSTVVVEKWSEEDNRDVIQANIWIERDSQKSIIIGKNGAKIGKVRKNAEIDIEQLTGKKAVLNLWVKVKHDWRKKPGALHEFGYK